MSKVILLSRYQKIPKGAEVECLGSCHCSGYLCYKVIYNGIEYYPLYSNCMTREEIMTDLQDLKTKTDFYMDILFANNKLNVKQD
jgi:hypothetical protein